MLNTTLDDNLLLLIIGVTIYKIIDLFSLQAKSAQSVVRIYRTCSKSIISCLLIVLRIKYKNNPAFAKKPFRDFVTPCFLYRLRTVTCIAQEYLYLLMVFIILTVGFLGFIYLGLKDVRDADMNKLIIALYTIFVSILVSSLSWIIEKLRLDMERIGI